MKNPSTSDHGPDIITQPSNQYEIWSDAKRKHLAIVSAKEKITSFLEFVGDKDFYELIQFAKGVNISGEIFWESFAELLQDGVIVEQPKRFFLNKSHRRTEL